jgi:hypothetical protein
VVAQAAELGLQLLELLGEPADLAAEFFVLGAKGLDLVLGADAHCDRRGVHGGGGERRRAKASEGERRQGGRQRQTG